MRIESRVVFLCKIARQLLIVIGGVLAVAACSDGGGGFHLPFDLVDTKFYAVDTADFNGDGATDIVFTDRLVYFRWELNYPDWDEDWMTTTETVIYLQDPDVPGSFLRQSPHRLVSEVFSIAAGDLDLNTIPDIAVTQTGNNAAGVFIQDLGSPGQFLPRIDFNATYYPRAVALGELNGDGVNDMAVAGNNLALLLNDAVSPGSAFSRIFLDVAALSSVAIADINGDDTADLAVTTGNTVMVLLQEPAPSVPGNFSKSSSYPTGVGAADVAIADLNGDSLPDLAVANRGDTNGSVSVLMQAPFPGGTFLAADQYLTGIQSVAVKIGDLNADSLLDLAVANNDETGGSVSVLLQDQLTQGVFSAAVNYPGMRGPYDIAINDMNGDGLNDLVVADKSSDPYQWPYIRYQDINNPGSFLDPVHLP